MNHSELKKNRLAWIHALESRKFGQERNRLKSKTARNSFCCLGVLCKLHPEIGKFDGVTFYVTADKDTNPENYEPPAVVKATVKLSEASENTVIRMNDDEGATFKDIANHLRKIWKLRETPTDTDTP
jgi:hypothetical protein